MQFITKKHIPRRTFLRGAGVTLALPLLDAMLPAQTPLSQTAANQPMKFTALWAPHGWAPLFWNGTMPADVAGLRTKPAGSGAIGEQSAEGDAFVLGPIHTPLRAFKDNLVIVGGIDSKASMPLPGSSGGDHSRASASYTGVHPKKDSGMDLYAGVSIDQMYAQKFGQETVLPSVAMGIEDPGSNTGQCGWGYACAYTNSISWSAPNQPLTQEINPSTIFERLFGDGNTAKQRQSRRERQKSILDSVTRNLATLKQRVGATDQNRLDQYLENVREVERRIDLALKSSTEQPIADVPFGIPASFDEHVKLMYDLTVIAFQADLTHVSSLMLARDVSLRVYPESGVTTGYHSSSHHGEDVQRREEYHRINRYLQQTIAYFLQKLKTTQYGQSNLFDQTLVAFTSNMGNANQHGHVNVAHMLVGGAKGRMKGNRYIWVPNHPAEGDFLLSTLHILGVDADSVGNSSGPIPGLG